jgi:hypothetical protein
VDCACVCESFTSVGRDKRVGDFGFGWTLGLHNIRLEKSGGLGFHWYETVSQELISNFCFEATARPVYNYRVLSNAKILSASNAANRTISLLTCFSRLFKLSCSFSSNLPTSLKSTTNVRLADRVVQNSG